MGSTQRGTTYHVVKTNKTGSRVAVSAQKGAEVASTTPQRGQGYLVSSSQRSGPASTILTGHRRSEAGQATALHLSSDYLRSSSPPSGPGPSGALNPRSETRSRTDTSRQGSPPRKLTQGESVPYTGQVHRNVSPSREEATRRGVETRPGRDMSNRFSLIPEAKSSRRLSFVDQKDDFILLEDEPPSKVQYPQGVRVPRRPLICPKDEAVQTEPIRKSVTAGDIRFPRRPLSPERGGNRISPDSRSPQRRIPGPGYEMGRQNSIYAEPKALRRSVNVESSLTLSVLKDLNSGHKVSVCPEPEPVHRPSVYNETKSSPKVLIPSQVEPSMKPSMRGESEGGRRVTISPGAPSASRGTSRAASESPFKSSAFVSLGPFYKQHSTKRSDSIYEFTRPTLRPPEPSSGKHSIHAEMELTPRPLPPRCLPRYGPDSTWWALLSTEGEMPDSRPITPDFEPKSPPPPDPSLPFFEMETSPFCEDLMFQREKIKRFLEDADDAELNKFVKDFPGSETYHPPEAKTLVPRPQIQEPRPQASDLCQDDLEFKPPSWPQPSDSQQYFSASAPLSPSARPRSPWGKLDPYDSSEDDKEYVGFATLPNQVHRKSVKKGFDFTLMVAGESGLGKSTLVNSLFLTDLYRDRKLLSAEERIMQTVEITKHAVDIEEKGVKLRLTIVDTPGFGDAVNNTECWKPVAEYIDQQFEQYFRDESGLNRKNIQDNRVHCCLYFISPFGHGLRPLDVEFMKALHQRVNIVPILAKADTLTPPEVERKKRKIREEIEHFGIKVYQFPDCDSDEDEDFKSQDLALKESIPFAVIGSNTVVEARGRRVRGRLYPWGIVEVENPGHCDFVKLRTMLVRTHMQDLKDVTRETHYENYRAQCIQSMTRLVVKERNRNKLTLESGTDFPLPAVPPGTDPETERLIREKDEELRRMQEMLHKIQRQMKETH
nr:septin-4 isoform X2 [Odocoileus virginianus texanus]